VLIYGAGKIGMNLKGVLESSNLYTILGYIDDNSTKRGKVIDGVQILPFSESLLDGTVYPGQVDELIIAVRNLSLERKDEIADICLRNGIKVRTIPPVEKWINGSLSISQVKDINIEYLLERDVIRLDSENISSQVKGKSVMITGAAGSIGSEIVRQLLQFNPFRIILVDQAESPLFDIENEVKEKRTGV
jgi:FlaA1/EpsC-like NDP-sugar epimerase